MNHLSNDPAKSYTANDGEFTIARPHPQSDTLNCHQRTTKRAKCPCPGAKERELETNFHGDVAFFYAEICCARLAQTSTRFSSVCYCRFNYMNNVYSDGFHKNHVNMLCVYVFNVSVGIQLPDSNCLPWSHATLFLRDRNFYLTCSSLIWFHCLVCGPQGSACL